jgi:peptide/nickel transport system substrate-binding protein
LITLTANSCYREPGKPFFKTVQIKGGGDATSAPRAVFDTADPNTEIDGERSSPANHHPFLSDQRVRRALVLAVDRATLARQLWGTLADATPNVLTVPTNLSSPNTRLEFDLSGLTSCWTSPATPVVPTASARTPLVCG